ncbi:MAG: translocation/assembly module TamB [Flavobacteriales bacterium]|nr:translocation/assembly module TamB [Flavobacteriales bacterium]
MRWTVLTIVTILFLFLVITVLLLYPVVQTWIAGILSDKLSKDLGITVRIERVELRPFAMNRLHGVFIADLHGDTLIAVEELRIRGLKVDPTAERITVRQLELHDARFALAKIQGDPHSNLTNILNKLASDDTTKGTADWKIHCGELDIQRLHFSFIDGNRDREPYGVDFDHVDVNTADIHGTDVRMAGDSILLDLQGISLRDHSGLVLEELSGRTQVCPRGIRIAGMRLKTPGTDLHGQLHFETTSLADFDEFETNVFMRVDLDSSRLQFSDIALFAPGLQGVDFPVMVSGKFRGTVSELKGRDMDLRFCDRSRFVGNVEFTGLPDVPNTFMVIDVAHFNTDPLDLAQLPVPPFIQRGRMQLPAEVERLGAVSFAGNFTGFVNSFTAYGQSSTEAGALRTDITYARDTITDIFQLRGSLVTGGFALGRVVGDPTVGNIACDVKVKASGRDFAHMTAELEGAVPDLNVDKLNITGITVKGRLEKNLFNGELHCDDPRLQLDFNGLADLRGRWPKVDFIADLQHFDPRAFGLIGGSGYSGLNMRVVARGELAPDSLKGSIIMEDVTWCEDSCDLLIGDLSLLSSRENGEALLQLRSSAADVDVRGPFYPTKLPAALKSVVFSVFPALQEEVRYGQEEQRFNFEATIKRAQPILDLVAPGLVVDSGTTASGNFDSRTFDLGLNAMVPHIQFGAFSGDSVDVVLDKTLDVLAFRFRSARQGVGDGSYISGIELTGKAYQDEVQLRAGWQGSNGGTTGDLNMDALVVNGHKVEVDLRPSSLYFGRGSWINDRSAHFEVDTNSISVDTLELRNEDQFITLGGTISEDPRSSLHFDLAGVQLENLDPFYDGPALHGFVGGDGSVFRLYDHPYLLSYLCVDSLELEGRGVGDLRFAATWNNAKKLIDLNGDLHRDTLRMLGFSGQLSPGAEQELDLQLLLDRFDLRFIDAYLPKGISDIQGKVSGAIGVSGKLAAPKAKGELALDRAGLRIDYLNTFYSFTDTVTVKPDEFTLDNVRLMDEEGNIARLNGNVSHKGFKKWSYDVSGTLNHIKVLNTGLAQNSLYYGTAYANGFIGLGGFEDNLDIYLEASTGAGTSLHFPLGASTEVGGIPFVRFVKAGENRDSLEAPIDLTGIHLDMKVNVTPDALFELIFDPTVGDIMRGRGRGDIDMSVTPSGEFSMKGGVEITEGDYLFTLRNLVFKKFTVDPGGHIFWYGDPFDAQLNINAVYKLRTALYDIMPPGERSEAYRKRVPVEVGMNLTEKLMNPDIGFQVRLPSVDEGTRTQVNTVLSDKDKLNKQVFALIVLNKFISDDINGQGAFAADAGASGATTLAEFASSQLNSLLPKISDNFDVGLNYRPGNSISADEFEVAVGTALFNDRVQVSTNVGVTGASSTSTQSGAQFIGDFNAEYLITHDGKLRLKAFSQSNDRNLNQLNQAQTTQGVGIAYREEFNTLGEFWTKFTNVFRKRENEKVLE